MKMNTFSEKNLYTHFFLRSHLDVTQFYTSVPWPLLQITPWVEYSVVHLDFLFHLKGIYYNFSNFQSFTHTHTIIMLDAHI